MTASIRYLRRGLAVALSLAACSAMAGEFEVWTYDSKGRTDVIVSFAGEGQTQDSQLDLSYDPTLEFVGAKVLVPGSVCVGFAEKGMIRAVPPSGAGSALAKSSKDYCKFSFKSKGAARGGNAFETSFIECASPGGASACNMKLMDVSDGPARGAKPGTPDRSMKGAENEK